MKITEMSIWVDNAPNKERVSSGVTFSERSPKKTAANVTGNGKKIPCRACVHARVDPKACEYTLKRCKVCDICDNPKECRYRREDLICPKQALVWTAYECGNRESEYNKSLLNVTPGGDMQENITWGGCELGETPKAKEGWL